MYNWGIIFESCETVMIVNLKISDYGIWDLLGMWKFVEDLSVISTYKCVTTITKT